MLPRIKKGSWRFWAGCGILFGVIFFYIPWITIFHISTTALTVYFIIEKIQNTNQGQASTSPGQQERALAIPRRLEDPQLRSNLEAAQQLVGRMVTYAPTLRRSVEDILRIRQDVQERYQPLLQEFPDWSRSCSLTIRTLVELREKLDTIYVAANATRLAGNTASLIGDVGKIAGFVFPQAADAAATFEAMQTIGNVADPIATVFESMISESFISDTKSVFQELATHSAPIVEFFECCGDLDRRFEEVFHCSFRETPPHDIIERMDNQVEGMRHLVDSSEIGSQIVCVDAFNEENRQLLSNISKLMENARRAFDNPRERQAITSFLQIVRIMNGLPHVDFSVKGMILLALKYQLQRHHNPRLSPNTRVVVQCLHEVPQAIMHGFSLYTSLRNVRAGNSEYSAPISSLEEQLQTELDLMTERVRELQ